MTKTYINTGFVPGSSQFVDTTDTVHPTSLSFVSKTTAVKVGTVSQRMVSDTLTVVAPFGITSCEGGECEIGQLNASAKISFNFPYGDIAKMQGVLDELVRAIAIWSVNNMAYGVVPLPTVDFNEA